MKHRILADLIALLHFLLVLVILAVFYLAIVTPRYRILAFFFCAMLLISWRIWGDCPSARLENHLRRQYNPKTAYHGSFIEHYSGMFLPFTIRDSFIKMGAFAILVVLIILSVT